MSDDFFNTCLSLLFLILTSSFNSYFCDLFLIDYCDLFLIDFFVLFLIGFCDWFL